MTVKMKDADKKVKRQNCFICNRKNTGDMITGGWYSDILIDIKSPLEQTIRFSVCPRCRRYPIKRLYEGNI